MSRFGFKKVCIAALAAVTSACAISVDGQPRDIGEDDRQPILPRSNAGPTTGPGRIYLVAPEQSARPVLRSVSREEATSADEALTTLFDGPNKSELDARFTTALPPNLSLIGAVATGDALSVDVTAELLDLTGDGAIRAVAQIVATASEIEGVRSVLLRVDGETLSWPIGNSEVVAGPLTVYDFPELLPSAQPDYPPIPSATRTGRTSSEASDQDDPR